MPFRNKGVNLLIINQKIYKMYLVKHNQSGFKHYFDTDQFTRFYETTGKNLLKKNKNFTEIYTVKKIKEYDTSYYLSEAFYFTICVLMVSVLTLAFIYYAAI